MESLPDLISQQMTHRLGLVLLHFVWQGAAIALLAAILQRAMSKATANLRYMIACLAMAALVVLPVSTFLLLSDSPPASTDSLSIQSQAGTESQANRQEFVIRSANSTDAARLSGAAILAIRWRQLSELSEPALLYVVCAWLIGVVGLSVWHAGGWLHVQSLRRRMVEQLERPLRSRLNDLAGRLGVHRPVQMLASPLIQVPTVLGWLRPVILLPASAMTALSLEQLDALLAHELAHIRRYDYLVNIVQTVVETLGFYHPAVWWVSHRIRLERENCCDDVAVAATGDRMRYAGALAEMERIRGSQVRLAVAAGGGSLFERIARLVDGKRVEAQPGWAVALIAVLLAVALAIPTTFAVSSTEAVGTLQTEAGSGRAASEMLQKAPPEPRRLSAPREATEAEGRAQILSECKVFDVPTNLKWAKDMRKGRTLILQFGTASADRLISLSKENKDVRVLSAPRVMTLDGEEARVQVGMQIPYTEGYSFQTEAGDKPEPVTKTAFQGIELQVKGKTLTDSRVQTRLSMTQSKVDVESYEDNEGREIQIPLVTRTDCTTNITVRDGEPIIIGGLPSSDNPQRKLILMITIHVLPAETEPQSVEDGGT